MEEKGLEQEESFGGYGGVYLLDVAVAYRYIHRSELIKSNTLCAGHCMPAILQKNENCLYYLTTSANTSKTST